MYVNDEPIFQSMENVQSTPPSFKFSSRVKIDSFPADEWFKLTMTATPINEVDFND